MIRYGQIRRHDDTAGAIHGHAERSGDRVGLHASGPEHITDRDELGAEVEALGRDVGHLRLETHLHAHGFKATLGALAELGREGRQHPVAAFEEDDAGHPGVDVPVVLRDRASRDLLNRSRQLDPGRSGTDDAEREAGLPRLVAPFELGRLEREQDALAQLDRILDALEARGDGGPLVVSEVGVGGAGGQDQIVVGKAPAGKQQLALAEIDAGDLGHGHLAVLLVPQHRANRRGDMSRREGGGGHLIEQRLEDVMVAPVDDGHIHRRVRQGLGGGEAGEASANDDDARSRCHPELSRGVRGHMSA